LQTEDTNDVTQGISDGTTYFTGSLNITHLPKSNEIFKKPQVINF